MPSRFPVESPREAAGVGAAVGLVVAAVVGVSLAPPGEFAEALVAVGCFLVAAPPAYVLARAERGERARRLLAYAAAWVAAGLVGVAVLHAWLRSLPGTNGVGAGGLLPVVGPGAWVAAAAALHLDSRGLVRFAAAVAALTAVGLGGGHALGPRLDAAWLPEAGLGAGLVAGLLGGAAAYRGRGSGE